MPTFFPGAVKNTVCFPVTGPIWVELSGMPHSAKNWPRVKVSVVLGDSTWMMPSFGVGVQPVEATSGFDEGALGGRHRLEARYAHTVRDDARLAVHEDGQMGVDVRDGLLTGVALDPVHRLSRRCGSQGRQLDSLGDRNAFRARRRGRDRDHLQRGGNGRGLDVCRRLGRLRAVRRARRQDDDEDDHQEHHERTPPPDGEPNSLGPQFSGPTLGCFAL